MRWSTGAARVAGSVRRRRTRGFPTERSRRTDRAALPSFRPAGPGSSTLALDRATGPAHSRPSQQKCSTWNVQPGRSGLGRDRAGESLHGRNGQDLERRRRPLLGTTPGSERGSGPPPKGASADRPCTQPTESAEVFHVERPTRSVRSRPGRGRKPGPNATGRIWNDSGDHCSEQTSLGAAADRLPRIGGRPARPRTGATSEGRCVRWAPLPGHVLGQRPVVGERWAVTSVRDRYPIARPSAGRQTSTGRQCAEVMPSGRPRSCRLTAGGRLHPQPGDLVRFSVAARWTRVAVVQSSAVPRGTSWSRCSPGRTTRCHLGISRRGPW